ncbi:hypothetical protein CDAR_21381 [Caerostris darwini]|uniref:Uncharacterized protein n=1 Tax=Caerostris darwini TaxID=1538125 RepID=A0AAV4VYG3_9ARAC|nr:hypothetical protein CDAR_21381 [Caerostris darwini]
MARHTHSKTKAAPPVPSSRRTSSVTGSVSDARAKTILKEAVDAVVNSFAKHTHGYGRGEPGNLFFFFFLVLFSSHLPNLHSTSVGWATGMG